MTAPAPKPIADCPNPECVVRDVKLRVYHKASDVSGGDRFQVVHDYCGYRGPFADSRDDAVRLHNLLSRPQQSAEPVTKLPAYWREVADMPAELSKDFDRGLRCCAADLEDALRNVAASPGPSELVEEMEALQRRDVVAGSGMGYMTGYRCVNDDNGDYILWDDMRALITRHRGKS